MKILCLYNNPCALPMFEWLALEGHETVLWTDRLEVSWCEKEKFDLAVSYTYRYILTEDLLRALSWNVVNMHNAMLPFNRGAEPNLWSIVDKTPRGVTLHYMDANLDKGLIIAQKEIHDDLSKETLKSSYDNLDCAALSLFKEVFPRYNEWKSMAYRAKGEGSYHRVKDGEKLHEAITSYDMPVSEFLKQLENQ